MSDNEQSPGNTPKPYEYYALGGNMVINEERKVALQLQHGRIAGYVLGKAIAFGEELRLGQRHMDGKNILGNRAYRPMTFRIMVRLHMGNAEFNDNIQNANPPEVFSTWKGNRTWAQWLRRAPYRNGPSRAQLCNLLQWNAYTMQQKNEGLASQLAAQRQEVLAEIETVAGKGMIASELVARAHATIPSARCVIMGPLSLESGGIANPRENEVLLESSYSPHIFRHELVHLLGGFKGVFLDEVATDMITHAFNPHPRTPEEESVYTYMERAMQHVLDKAGITTHELSALFAGNSREENTNKLHQLVRERLGNDSLRELEARFGKRQRFYARRIFSRQFANLLSSLELAQELEPHITTAELIHRDFAEQLKEEDIQILVKGMSLLQKSTLGHVTQWAATFPAKLLRRK